MNPWERFQGGQVGQPTNPEKTPGRAGNAAPWARFGRERQIYDIDDPQSPLYGQRHGGSFVTGLVDAAKSAFTLPRDVYEGTVDLNSDEATGRVFDMATLASPMPPGTRAAGATLRKVMPPIPTGQDLKSAARKGFREVLESGVDYSVPSVQAFSTKLKTALEKEGFREADAPKAHGVLNDLIRPPSEPGGRTVSDIGGIISARKSAARNARKADNDVEREASSRVARGLDVFIERDGPKTAVAGPAAEAGKAQRAANKNYAAAKRSEKLREGPDSAEHIGELNASVANSGANSGNSIRQRLAAIIRSPKQRRGFDADEIAGIEKAATGGIAANSLRNVGNAIAGYGTMASAVVGGVHGGYEGGIAGILAGQAIGRGLKYGSTALTKRALRKVDEATRMRSPLYQERLAQAPMTSIPAGRGRAIAKALALIEAEKQRKKD